MAGGIIKCYGLLWKAEDVFWGSGGQPGKLLGVWTRARTKEVDFHQQIGIYVLYRGHQMVYVGQTGSGNLRLFYRLRSHHKFDYLAGRWDRFSWFGLLRVLRSGKLSMEKIKTTTIIKDALNHIEAVLIAAAEPTLNKQGGRFGRDARRYLQKRDPRLGRTESEMLDELLKQNETLHKEHERLQRSFEQKHRKLRRFLERKLRQRKTPRR
ncbi:MAG TPA: hypothetical protein VMY37_32020 [Thermoguttaceae bacterium]|nr:hypothetical protein [Thermoguttaceae bacterium]